MNVGFIEGGTVKRIKFFREIRNAFAGLLLGFGFSSWFMMFYFEDKWLKTSRPAAGGDAVYAHVEHGGVSYYTAIQSVVSHMYFAVWLCLPLALLVSQKKNIKMQTLRVTWEQDDPFNLMWGCAIMTALLWSMAIYFRGHNIIEALIGWGLSPSNDSLDLVDHT